ncbi:MAG: NIL domain-containing protein [bacterium]
MVSHRIVLIFPKDIVDKPYTYHLVKDFNLVINILRAKISPEEEGLLVLEVDGKKIDFENGMKYLKDFGVKILPLLKEINRDKKRCYNCGACLAVCPSGALYIDRNNWLVNFDDTKCVLCEACIKGCPTRAIKILFQDFVKKE